MGLQPLENHDERMIKKKTAARWMKHKVASVLTKRFWSKRVPIFGFVQGYNASSLLSDMIAGFTVALTVIPQSMAIALVAGLPPQYGLYSAFINGFIYAFLGSTKAVSVGPTVISAMLTKPFVDKFGPEIAVTLCFYSGCIVSLLAILNLGFLVDFISTTVLAGFVSACSVSVISGQIPGLLGMRGGGDNFIEYWISIFNNFHDIKLWDTALGIGCIAILSILQYTYRFSEVPAGEKKMSRRERLYRGTCKYLGLGRNAIVVLISTVLVSNMVDSDGITPVAISGDIPEGLPEFRVPQFVASQGNTTLSIAETLAELTPGFVMSLTIIMECIMSAKAFVFGATLDVTQELISIGVCNIAGSFVQSFAVTSSITRTAINHFSGVTTPLAGVFTGGLVLLSLMFLTSTLKFLPKATLAAVVICAVLFLTQIHKDTIRLWKTRKLELLPLHATFLGALVIGPAHGMVIGIGVDALILLYQTSRPRVVCETIKLAGRVVLMVQLDRAVTYPAAEYVKHKVMKCSLFSNSNLQVFVLNGEHVSTVDTTGIKVLCSLLTEVNSRGLEIVLWNWNRTAISIFLNYDQNLSHSVRSGDNLEVIISDMKIFEVSQSTQF